MRFTRSLALVSFAVVLTACSKPPPVEEPVRAVRTQVVGAGNVAARHEYAAEIRARTESRLAFRVPGKLVRLWPDGRIPDDNPFVGQDEARPEIWSLGHRNMQGAALHPVTRQLWTSEHGPKGGDELNIPQAGRNYGWPIITNGLDYSGQPVPDSVGSARDGLERPHISGDRLAERHGVLQRRIVPAWKGTCSRSARDRAN